MHRLLSWCFSKKKSPPVYSADLNPTTRSLPEANKWILSEYILGKLIGIVGVHPYPLDELLLMCSTLAYFKPDMVIEWGTHYGKSARIFYEATTYLNLKTVIHTIDLPPTAEHCENIHNDSQRGLFIRNLPVIRHLGDGLTVARKIIAEVNPKLVLFFVDGDHSFASIRDELNGIKCMAPRAVVLVHDTFLQGSESGYNCGPYSAIKEFTAQHQLEYQATILGLPGMCLTYWL